MKRLAYTLWIGALLLAGCLPALGQPARAAGGSQRIVSLNRAVSEILAALGLESAIVGVDVTSTYPASLKAKPQVGHNRNISAEGMLALHPTLVIGLASQVTPSLSEQLRAAGVRTVLVTQQLTEAGVRDMLMQVADAVGAAGRAPGVLAAFDRKMEALQVTPLSQRVLFIYARGAGTMLVSGAGTAVDALIRLAGAANAVTAFSDYKPLTAESLVAANPDVILMFTDGLKSMGGMRGLMKVPGVAQTTAGRTGKIVTMDGELLAGFSLRLPQAIGELRRKIMMP